jgi:tetrahydromethanopterin S-methyltransferase subunit G
MLKEQHIDEERVAASIAARLSENTTNVATQLAALTADSNAKVATALAEIKGEVKGINERLGNYVPAFCIAHNRDMEMIVKRTGDIEAWKDRVNGEHEALKEKVGNYEKRITGLYVLCGGLTVSVLAGIVLAIIKYVGKGG